MDSVRNERTATRRLLSRALFVLGGAVAAWAVSASTAAADTGTDLARDLGAAVESAPLPDSALLTEGKTVVVDLVEGAAHMLHTPAIRDGAQTAVDQFGKSVAQHFGHAVPGQRVENLLPSLPDLSPRPDSAAAGDPQAAAPEIERPVAVPAATPQRHGEPATQAITPVDADSTTTRGPPETSSEAPGLPGGPSPLAPLTLPAPAHSGHSGTGAGDAPQFGLLSTVPAATEPATVRTPRAVRVDVPATVDAQPGVTPD